MTLSEIAQVAINFLRPGLASYVVGMLTFGAILWIPESASKELGLTAFRSEYRAALGVGLIFFSFLTLVNVGQIIGPKIVVMVRARMQKARDLRTRSNEQARFYSLSTTEKAVIGYCVETNRRRFVSLIDSRILQSLVDQKILTFDSLGGHGFIRYEIDAAFWDALQPIRSEVRASIDCHDVEARNIIQQLH